MKILPELHDATILSIAHLPQHDRLHIGVRLDDGSDGILVFYDAKLWSLSPFESQNIVFEIRAYNKDKPPYHIDELSESELYPAILSGVYECYEVDSSIGMAGFVVARSIQAQFAK